MAGGDESKAPEMTYQYLYDSVRLEKQRNELQKLHPSFFDDAKDYLTQLSNSIVGTYTQETERQFKQLSNTQRLIKDLFDIRETKIIKLAHNKAKTSQSIINIDALLPNEREFYEGLLTAFSKNRKSHRNRFVLSPVKENNVQKIVNHGTEDVSESQPKNLLDVKLLVDVPKFVGKDLQTYGPYKEGEITSLPKQLASILIKKEKAQEV